MSLAYGLQPDPCRTRGFSSTRMRTGRALSPATETAVSAPTVRSAHQSEPVLLSIPTSSCSSCMSTVMWQVKSDFRTALFEPHAGSTNVLVRQDWQIVLVMK